MSPCLEELGERGLCCCRTLIMHRDFEYKNGTAFATVLSPDFAAMGSNNLTADRKADARKKHARKMSQRFG